MHKAKREAVRTLEPYGFDFEGDAGDYLVFRTKEGLALRISKSTGKANNVEHLRRRAAQTINARNKASALFIHWLRQKYGIGDYDRKELRLHLRNEAREFAASSGLEFGTSLGTSAAKGSDFVEILKAPNVGGDVRHPDKGWGRYALLGDLYGTDVPGGVTVAEPAGKACDVSLELPNGGGVAVCSRSPGHEGEHQDKYRKVAWAEERVKVAATDRGVEVAPIPDMPAPSPTPPVVTEAVTEAPVGREEQVKALLSGIEGLLLAPTAAEQDAQVKLDMAVEVLVNVQTQISTLLAVLHDAE